MNVKKPDPIDIFVGGRVRIRRVILGLTQERLADRLGITFQQVQKYEKGTNRISASRLMTIADILGVPPSFFFHEDNRDQGGATTASHVQKNSDMSEYVLTTEGIALNKAFAKITNVNIRKKIIALVQTMAEHDPALAAEDGATMAYAAGDVSSAAAPN